MTKFAPVCPIRMYEQLKKEAPGMWGDYFLLLAHDVVKNAKRYSKVFIDENACDYTIIMDNSVIELGTAARPQVLADACRAVNADVLAIPDVLENGLATVDKAVEFLNEWNPLMVIPPKLMFIPQGDCMDDYVECVMRACDLNIPMDWIGIARNVTDRLVTSREQLIGFFATLLPESKLHLLGFSSNPYDDLRCAKSPLVAGIDSAVPLRTRDFYNKDSLVILDPGPRGDWWENGILYQDQINNAEIIHQLIGASK